MSSSCLVAILQPLTKRKYLQWSDQLKKVSQVTSDGGKKKGGKSISLFWYPQSHGGLVSPGRKKKEEKLWKWWEFRAPLLSFHIFLGRSKEGRWDKSKRIVYRYARISSPVCLLVFPAGVFPSKFELFLWLVSSCWHYCPRHAPSTNSPSWQQ